MVISPIVHMYCVIFNVYGLKLIIIAIEHAHIKTCFYHKNESGMYVENHHIFDNWQFHIYIYEKIISHCNINAG